MSYLTNDLVLEQSSYLMTLEVHEPTALEVGTLLFIQKFSNIEVKNYFIVNDRFLLFGDFFPNGMRNKVKMYPSSVTISCSSAGYPSCLIRSGFEWIQIYIFGFVESTLDFSYSDLPQIVSISLNLKKILLQFHRF